MNTHRLIFLGSAYLEKELTAELKLNISLKTLLSMFETRLFQGPTIFANISEVSVSKKEFGKSPNEK